MKVVVPVWRKSVAGPCATPSVCIERITHSLSACRAISGKSSETHSPLCPRCRNSHIGFITRCVPPFPVFAIERASSKSIIFPSSAISRGL